MAYWYINTKPRQDEVPENMRYIFITKEYPKPSPPEGKKRCTKEQNDSYKEAMDKRNQMFAMLDSGHYDIGNSFIEVKPFTNDLFSFLEGNSYAYKIKPINAHVEFTRYDRKKYYVSKFDIEKRIDNIYELIDDLSDSMYYADLFHYIFDKGHFKNNGYRENSIQLFKYAKEKHPNKKIYLCDCIQCVLHSYDTDGRYKKEPEMEQYVFELLDNNLIELINNDFYFHDTVVENLIIANWFKIAVDYIKVIPESLKQLVNDSIGKNKIIISILSENSDKEPVKQILSLLDMKDICLTLNIFIHDCWGWEETVETKTFVNMNEVRSYVIQKYNVPFEKACLDVGMWRGKNGEEFSISG